MKKRLFIMLAFIIASMCFFTACGDTSTTTPTETSFTVTVVNGTGGGDYDSGDECTVTATVGDSQEFKRWIDGDKNAVSTANPYTFTVSEDITLTAEFTDIEYSVSVTNGKADSTTYIYGDTATVTATTSDEYSFVKWVDADNNDISTVNPYSFTVEGNSSISAILEYSKVVAGKAVITVTNGTINNLSYIEADENSTVTAVASAPTNTVFTHWENAAGDILSYDSSYTFTATSNLTLIAVCKTIKTQVLEAESIDVVGLSAPGQSNMFTDVGIIFKASDYGIADSTSNGYFIGGTQQDGMELEFNFYSDIAAEDASLTLRLTSEFGKTVTVTKDDYGIEVNGTELDYGAFSLSGGTKAEYNGVPCKDYAIDVTFDLVEGLNTITFIVYENDFIADFSGTFTNSGGGSPGMDCIKITTHATLSWVEDMWPSYVDANFVDVNLDEYKGIYTE